MVIVWDLIMGIYLNTDSYFDRLLEIFDEIKPTKVTITSYGFFVGIMPDGRDLKTTWKKFKSRARDFLEYITDKTTVNVLVGLYAFDSCCKEHRCKDCESKYVTNLVRLVLHAEAFPMINWRISDTSHIKCVLMENKKSLDVKVVTGSRNFSDSTWTDISMDIDDFDNILEIREFLKKEWSNSMIVDNESINHFLSKNKIELYQDF